MTRYVGVDLHRRRSVIVVLDADGTELWTKRIDNDPLTLGLGGRSGFPPTGTSGGGLSQAFDVAVGRC